MADERAIRSLVETVGELLLEPSGPTSHPRRLNRAIDAGRSAQKSLANYCTICCTIPDVGGWLAESLTISSTRCGEVSADLQWEMSRFLAESAQVADQETVTSWPRHFAQVLTSRTLSVYGEVAERLKAAVC